MPILAIITKGFEHLNNYDDYLRIIMRGYWILALLFLASSLYGQSGDNPFDIPNRKASIDTIDKMSTEVVTIQRDVISDNPFDVRVQQESSVPAEEVRYEEPTTTNVMARPSPSAPLNKAVFALLFLLSLVLIAVGINTNTKRFKGMMQSLYNSNNLKALVRQGRQLTDLQNILLYIAFWLVGSVFLYLASRTAGYGMSWWLAPLILLGVYAGRHIVMYLISYIYPVGKAIDVHNLGIGIHNMVLTIPLVIAGLGLLFGPESMNRYFLIFGLGAILLFYVARQLKGALLAVQLRGFNPIYFFLYLCAVEVAPVLVALRVIGQA